MKIEKPDKVPPSDGSSGVGSDAPASGNMSNHQSGAKGASTAEKNWKTSKVPASSTNSDM